MNHEQMLKRVKDRYQDDLDMWKLAKKKAKEKGYLTAVEDFNIVRCQNKIDQIQELITDVQEREKSLHQDLYKV